MPEQKIAGVEGLGFEGCAVGGNEKPVVDFAGEKLDGTERGELAAEGSIGGVGGFGEYEPKAIVAGRFGVVAQHADEAVAAIDSEAGKHATYFRVQGRERLADEGVGRFLFRLGGAGHGVYGEDSRLGRTTRCCVGARLLLSRVPKARDPGHPGSWGLKDSSNKQGEQVQRVFFVARVFQLNQASCALESS